MRGNGRSRKQKDVANAGRLYEHTATYAEKADEIYI